MAVGQRVYFTGLNEVIGNLNRRVARIKGKTVTGLREGARIVHAQSDRYVPRKTGHLAGTGDFRAWRTPRGAFAVIYYTADYAPFVHEINTKWTGGSSRSGGMVGTPYTYTTPGTGWKFLERAMSEKRPEVLKAIRDYSRVDR